MLQTNIDTWIHLQLEGCSVLPVLSSWTIPQAESSKSMLKVVGTENIEMKKD